MERLKTYFASRRSPDQFKTFAILYMVPVVHELGDPWWSWSGMHAPLLLKSPLLVGVAYWVVRESLRSNIKMRAAGWAFTAMLTFALAAGVEMGDVLAGFSTDARIRAKCMSLVEREGYTSACQFRHFGYHVKRVHC